MFWFLPHPPNCSHLCDTTGDKQGVFLGRVGVLCHRLTGVPLGVPSTHLWPRAKLHAYSRRAKERLMLMRSVAPCTRRV
eukprot:767916-Hanusia_phi.AAC.6